MMLVDNNYLRWPRNDYVIMVTTHQAARALALVVASGPDFQTRDLSLSLSTTSCSFFQICTRPKDKTRLHLDFVEIVIHPSSLSLYHERQGQKRVEFPIHDSIKRARNEVLFAAKVAKSCHFIEIDSLCIMHAGDKAIQKAKWTDFSNEIDTFTLWYTRTKKSSSFLAKSEPSHPSKVVELDISQSRIPQLEWRGTKNDASLTLSSLSPFLFCEKK